MNLAAGQEWTAHRKEASKHWLTCSVCPSVWGWYDELNCNSSMEELEYFLSQSTHENMVPIRDNCLW
uniref:Uncharacterized protein n=1 Tax=Arundo donax TaxID=35708 RepID=A0A0A9U8Y9_ARUDO